MRTKHLIKLFTKHGLSHKRAINYISASRDFKMNNKTISQGIEMSLDMSFATYGIAEAQRRLTECIKSSAGQYRDIAWVIMELDNFPVKQLTNPFETINK